MVKPENFAYEGLFYFGYTVLEEEGAELIFAERMNGKRRSIVRWVCLLVFMGGKVSSGRL